MKVVVLYGGLSSERKISLASGTRVCQALRDKGHQAILVDLFMGVETYGGIYEEHPEKLFEDLPPIEEVVFDGTPPDLNEVRASRRDKSEALFGPKVLFLCREADIVFIALHGANGEDGRVQATFDMLAIKYTGSGYTGSAIAMDKVLTKQLLQPVNIPMAHDQVYRFVTEEDLNRIARETPIPCVVKTPCAGSSLGVYIVHEEEDLMPALQGCLAISDTILVEEYIEGCEFTCAVLCGRALPSVEIVPKTQFYNYENKYATGASDEYCPGRTSPENEKKMGEIALKVHDALSLHTYSRSDFIITPDDRVIFLEVNTLPGMTGTSLVPQEAAAVGISFEDLCEMILQDGMKRV